MPDETLQNLYTEALRRGLFQSDPELQAIGHELRARKLVTDATQGGLVTPQKQTSASMLPPVKLFRSPEEAKRQVQQQTLLAAEAAGRPDLNYAQGEAQSVTGKSRLRSSASVSAAPPVSTGQRIVQGVQKAGEVVASPLRKVDEMAARAILESGGGTQWAQQRYQNAMQKNPMSREYLATTPFWNALDPLAMEALQRDPSLAAGIARFTATMGTPGNALPLTGIVKGGNAVSRVMSGAFGAPALLGGTQQIADAENPGQVLEGILNTIVGTAGLAHAVTGRPAVRDRPTPQPQEVTRVRNADGTVTEYNPLVGEPITYKPERTKTNVGTRPLRKKPAGAQPGVFGKYKNADRPRGETVLPPSDQTSAAVDAPRTPDTDTLYHGSPQAGLTEIAPSLGDYGQGVYLGNEPLARYYSQGRKNVAAHILGDTNTPPAPGTVYPVDVKPKNPLLLDTPEKYQAFSERLYREQLDETGRMRDPADENLSETRLIAKYARQMGHDAIRLPDSETVIFTDKAIPVSKKPVSQPPIIRENIQPSPIAHDAMNPEDIGVLEGMQYKKQGITDAKNAVSDTLKGTDVYDVEQGGRLTEEAPKVIQPEVVRNTKPAYEMTPDEIESAIQQEQAHEKGAAVRVFGPEGAKVYQAAQRTANSLNADRIKQQQADATIARMEANLTPEQQKDLFGIGETGANVDDLKDYRRALGSLAWDSPEDLGRSLRTAITDVGEKTNPADMLHSEQVAYAKIRYALTEAKRRGWDTAEISRHAVEGARARFDTTPYMGESDADFMTRRYRTETAPVSEPPAPKSLPAPTPTRPLILSDEQGAILQDTLGYDHPLSQRIEAAFADGKTQKTAIPFTEAELATLREATAASDAKAKEGGVSMAGVKKQLSPKPVSQPQAKLPSGKKSKPGAFQFGAKPGSPAAKVSEAVQKILPSAEQKAAVTKTNRPSEKRANPLRSPLSNVDAFGETIGMPGSLETRTTRSGNKSLGMQVNERFVQAREAENTQRQDFNRKLDAVTSLLKDAFPKVPKDLRDKAFIDLIERKLTDPQRVKANNNPKLKEALDRYDTLTGDVKKYIYDSMNAYGAPPTDKNGAVIPFDKWGITEKGFFHHLFLGDLRLYDAATGDEIKSSHGFFYNYAEAQGKVNELLKADPNAKFRIEARDITAGDPTIRLPGRQYHGLVERVKDNVNTSHNVDLSHSDIMADMRGDIGTLGNKRKFAGTLQKRKGAAGYSLDFEKTMRAYGSGVARSQELSKLQHDLYKQNGLVDQLKAAGEKGTVGDVEDMMKNLWGSPTILDQFFGFGVRSVASNMARVQNFLKLDFNISGSLANLLQPLSTLWPEISTKDFAAVYADYLKPATRQRLRDLGVFEGEGKTDATGNLITIRKKAPPFQQASSVNRGVGYLAGEKIAERKIAALEAQGQKFTPEEKAAILHRNGEVWAQQTEFASGKYDKPPILRGAGGQLFGQYKTFTLKMNEHIAHSVRPRKGDTALGYAGRNAKLAMGTLLPAGVRATGIIGKSALGVYAIKQLSSWGQSLGLSKDNADALAAYGAAGLAGVDMSQKVGVFEPPFGNNPKEQIGGLVAGPTLGGLLDAGMQAYQGKPQAALEGITPLARTARVVYQGVTQGGAKEKIGRRQTTLTPLESLGMALGFPPVRKAQAYDQMNARR